MKRNKNVILFIFLKHQIKIVIIDVFEFNCDTKNKTTRLMWQDQTKAIKQRLYNLIWNINFVLKITLFAIWHRMYIVTIRW